MKTLALIAVLALSIGAILTPKNLTVPEYPLMMQGNPIPPLPEPPPHNPGGEGGGVAGGGGGGFYN